MNEFEQSQHSISVPTREMSNQAAENVKHPFGVIDVAGQRPPNLRQGAASYRRRLCLFLAREDDASLLLVAGFQPRQPDGT